MISTRFVRREELEGHTFVQGEKRIEIEEQDLVAFVDPPDGALAIASSESGPVWMATLRRKSGDDALVGLHRMGKDGDAPALAHVMVDIYRHAHALGYRRLWFAANAFEGREPALKLFVEAVRRPLEAAPLFVTVAVGAMPVE